MAASIALGCGGKGYFAGQEPFGSRYARLVTRYIDIAVIANSLHADHRIHPRQRKLPHNQPLTTRKKQTRQASSIAPQLVGISGL